MPIKRTIAPEASDYAAPVFEEETIDESSASTVGLATLRGGWDVAEKMAASSSGQWSKDIKFDGEEPLLIAFLQGQPIDAYHQHWIHREGRKSFRCAEEGCPLCAAGDSRSARFVFHVLEFTDTGEEAKIWTSGKRVMEQLRAIDADPRKGGPLDGGFFSVHRTGKAQQTVYSINRVTDLAKWGLPEKEAKQAVEEARKTDVPALSAPSMELLEEVAAEIRRGA